MAGEAEVAGSPLSRRRMLRLASVGTVVAVLASAGCDIRLEDDAPNLPLLHRKSVPDEALLVEVTRATGILGQLAGRVPDPSATVARLAGAHQTQSTVLRGRLVAAGVPQHVIDEPSATATSTSTATPTSTAAVSAPPRATVADLTAAEAAAVAALLPRLATVTAPNRPVLVSVAAACVAAVEELGATVTWPAVDPLPPAVATALLDDTRAAGYAMQVVAAQTSGAQRDQALATHTALGTREAQLLAAAGAGAPPAPLGYALPFPVTGAPDAARLATQVLTTLVAGSLAPLSALPEGSTAVVPLVDLLAGAVRMGSAWGVAATPFPGLAYP
jgi:hypothetical protein